MRFSRILLAAVLAAGIFVPCRAKVKLPGYIADKMVLQRDTPLTLRGWSDPGEKVSVRFRGEIFRTEGGPDGKWEVTIPKQTPGGPFLLEVNDIVLRDVLVGDLWLFSGQSNQEHAISRAAKMFPEVNLSDNNKIRHFKVPTCSSPRPKDDILPGGKWNSGVASEVMNWTSLAYFFAQKAYEATGVPQGILVSCLGGSSAETWIDPETLTRIQPGEQPLAEMLRKAEDTGAGVYTRCDYDDSDWKRVSLPAMWSDAGISHKGTVWFRKKIDVPESMAGRHARLSLGTLVNADSTFVNGRFVGVTFYEYPPRDYTVPAGILKAGENVIAVKLTDNNGRGGFIPDKDYCLVCDGDTILLSGEWSWKEGREAGGLERLNGMYSQPMTARSGLFNGMLLPLAGSGFKGAVWYQGESNAGRPHDYKDLLAGLVSDWRGVFKDENLPFVVVQLPNFMKSQPVPSESGWAKLREAQMQAADSIPGVSFTVNYDLGEWNDIHPLNKKDVAERVWLSALQNIYGDPKCEGTSPAYEKMEVKGDKVILTFSHTGKRGLRSKEGKLRHFAVAGADRKFVWADAVAKGDKVIVSSPEVKDPVAVRYAWADNPEGANLVSSEGLPAEPFRTDSW